jgi:hypothetical protein
MEPLKGQVSFDTYAAAPQYVLAPVEDKVDAANRFFDDHYASTPQYKQASPEDQNNARQRFLSDYKLPTQVKAPQGTNFIGDVANSFGNSISGYTQDDLARNQGGGVGSFLGNLGGDVLSSIGGGFAGAGVGSVVPGVGTTAGGLIGTVGTGTARGGLAEAQRERLASQNPDALRIAAAAGLGGVTSFPLFKAGGSLLGRAAKNAGFDFALGASGDIGSQAIEQGNLLPNIDWQRALQTGSLSGVGGGVGTYFHGRGVKSKSPRVPVGRQVEMKAPGAMYGDFGRSVGTRERLSGPVKNTRQFIKDANQFTSIDAKTTAQRRAAALKQRYDILEAQHAATPTPELKARIRKAQAILQKHFKDEKAAVAPIKAGKAQLAPGSDTFNAVVQFGKELRAEGKIREANVALSQYHPETKAKLFDEIHKLENVEKKHAATAKAQYEADYKKLLTEEKAASKQQQEIKAQIEKTQNLKDKEALQSQKALLKAESKARQSELKKLKGDIANRTKAEELEKSLRQKQARNDLSALEKAEMENQKRELRRLKGDIKSRAEAVPKEKAAPKPKPVIQKKDLMSVHKMREIAREANKAGESVRIRYMAERTGETAEIEYKTLHDVKIIEGKVGKETRWKGINAEGQDHHYIERNGSNSLDDSNIISVERTHEPIKFKRELHPETGTAHPVDVETGEFIPQTYKAGVKSSKIRADLSKMEAVLERVRNGNASIDEIMEAAKPMSEKEFTDSIEKADQAKIDEIGKKADC